MAEVFNEVKKHGDKAIQNYTQKFDGVSISKVELKDFENRKNDAISASLQRAIQRAYKNIYKFHKAQKTALIRVNTDYGVECWQDKKPIENVGIYIPGECSTFLNYFNVSYSSKKSQVVKILFCVLHQTKKVKFILQFSTPPNLCGVTAVMTVGGIQAIADLLWEQKVSLRFLLKFWTWKSIRH